MEEYLRLKRCNYCNSLDKKLLFKIGLQNLVRCKKCNLVFLDRQRVDIENLYNKNYYEEAENDGIDANYYDYTYQEKVVKNKFKFAYSYIKKNCKRGYKLLEIGPGYGYFLKYLPKNLDISAIEVSKLAAKMTKENNPKAKVFNQDFSKTKIASTFKFITAFDVIEHQIDLKKFLTKVNKLLDKNGMFIFATPDYGTIFNKLFGKRAPAIQPLYHNYYFEKKWLKDNASELGFKVIYLNTIYFEPMNIGCILLYATFAIPILKKIPSLNFIKFLKIDKVVIPFFRFGGIECILQKQ